MATKNRKVSFGLKPTPNDISPWGTFGATGAGTTPEADNHLSKFVRRGGNQNPTNTCVWWALAGAMWTVLGYEGLRQLWLSVLEGYYMTRLKTHGGNKNNVVDFGCRPPDAAQLLNEHGFVLDKTWPFIASNVDKEPPYDAVVSGDHEWFSLKRIIVPYGGREKAVRHIIHNLHRPVLVGQEVNDEYVNWEPGDFPWTLAHGTTVGRHMELIAVYDQYGPNTVSSWGDRFDRQVAWMQLESDYVSDLWYPVIDKEKFLQRFGGLA